MTSRRVILALFLCMAVVQKSLQEKETQSLLEKRKELLKMMEGLESSIKRQEQVKREKELKKKRKDELEKLTDQLAKLQQEDDKWSKKASLSKAAVALDDAAKRACSNRLPAGKCQLLRWFGKGCAARDMRVTCKASCGFCDR